MRLSSEPQTLLVDQASMIPNRITPAMTLLSHSEIRVSPIVSARLSSVSMIEPAARLCEPAASLSLLAVSIAPLEAGTVMLHPSLQTPARSRQSAHRGERQRTRLNPRH